MMMDYKVGAKNIRWLVDRRDKIALMIAGNLMVMDRTEEEE